MNDAKYIVERRFAGKVVIADAVEIPVVLTLEHDKYEPSKIKGELSPAPDVTNSVERAWLFNPGIPRELIFAMQSPIETRIRLYAFSSMSKSESEVSMEARVCEIGLSNLSVANAEMAHVIVLLTNAKCLAKWGSQSVSFDGSITMEPGYPEEIEWQTPYGKAEARVRHEYEDETVAGNKAVLQIQIPSITVEVDTTKTHTVAQVVEGIRSELQDVCLLLALCSRQIVDWFDLQMMLRVKAAQPTTVQQPHVRRWANKVSYTNRTEELINHRDLVKGGFDHLLQKLRSSPHEEVLRRAIPFIVASYAPGFTETKYFLCYSALNALCDSVEEISPDLSENQWKRIKSKLRARLEAILTEEDLAAEFGLMAKKLPELKRAPEMDAMLDTVGRLGVEVSDLWKKKAFAEGLNEARKMRNALFHTADRNDIYGMDDNLIRLGYWQNGLC